MKYVIKIEGSSSSIKLIYIADSMLHWQGRAGQGRAGQGRAGQGRAGQGRAGQGRAGQGRAGQGRAGQGRAGQGRAGQGRAGQVDVVEFVYCSGSLKRPADDQELLMTPSKRIKKLEMTNPGKLSFMTLF